MNRREFSVAALAALAASQLPFSRAAHAQGIGTLKMMIPANPGGGWDQTGRALGAAMQAAKVVQSVQFDNKGGAAGTIGLAQFVNPCQGRSRAAGRRHGDGRWHRAQQVAGGLSMVTPVARLTSEWTSWLSSPPVRRTRRSDDLIDAFKADPGKVSWNGGSAGGSDHILAGLIAKAVGGDPAKVNYVASKGGGDQVANIVGGHVTAGIAGLGEFAEHIKGGRMRALAVSAPAKGEGIPSLKEQGIDVVLGNWRGVFGAPGITTAQRDALISAVKAATESAPWKETLAKLGWESVFLPGDQYKAFVEEDTKRIAGILESLGMKK